MSKNYLAGIRENAIQTLADQSMLNPKIECDLHEDVLPWLKAKIASFSGEDNQAVDMTSDIIEGGIAARQIAHGVTLKAREERLAREVAEREEAAR